MNVKINGQEEVLPEETLNLRELVIQRGLVPERVVIEYNFQVVLRENWPLICLQERDNVEIVSFVGGG
jgi:sulfur carrier protein